MFYNNFIQISWFKFGGEYRVPAQDKEYPAEYHCEHSNGYFIDMSIMLESYE